MAKNLLLKPRTIRDIDDRIDRVLRGLGNPEPPLYLEDARELLELDLEFYSADDPGILREAVSRIRVGAIQAFRRPMRIFEAVKKWDLQSLYVPDHKRILLDKGLPQKKHRWSEAHEIVHSLLPWHDGMMHGDNKWTLSQGCHEKVEAEANFGAGRLLFLRDRFTEEARDVPLNLESIKQLKGDFGNTFSSTLWRFVETVGTERPVVGMISCHPHVSRRPADFNPAEPCRHCIQSSAFAAHFGKLTEVDLFEAIATYCAPKLGGPLGVAELILTDDNGDEHRFVFESFFIRYRAPAVGEALTLGIYEGPVANMIAV